MLLCDISIQMKNKIFRDHSGFGSSLKQEFKKKNWRRNSWLLSSLVNVRRKSEFWRPLKYFKQRYGGWWDRLERLSELPFQRSSASSCNFLRGLLWCTEAGAGLES